MITHCRLSWEKWRSCLIAGRATFTTATSTMTMNCAATVTASTSQRLLSGLVASIAFIGPSLDVVSVKTTNERRPRGQRRLDVDGQAARSSYAGLNSGRARSSLIWLGAARRMSDAAVAAATRAASAPVAASKKKWLPVATTTSSTNGASSAPATNEWAATVGGAGWRRRSARSRRACSARRRRGCRAS